MPNDENKKPQPKPETDTVKSVPFEPSTESAKNEPTPERAREEKDRQTEK